MGTHRTAHRCLMPRQLCVERMGQSAAGMHCISRAPPARRITTAHRLKHSTHFGGGTKNPAVSGECHGAVALSYSSCALLEKPSASSDLLFSYYSGGGRSILLPPNSRRSGVGQKPGGIRGTRRRNRGRGPCVPPPRLQEVLQLVSFCFGEPPLFHPLVSPPPPPPPPLLAANVRESSGSGAG